MTVKRPRRHVSFQDSMKAMRWISNHADEVLKNTVSHSVNSLFADTGIQLQPKRFLTIAAEAGIVKQRETNASKKVVGNRSIIVRELKNVMNQLGIPIPADLEAIK